MRIFLTRIIRTILGILLFSGIFLAIIDTGWNATFTNLYSDIFNHGNQESKQIVLEKLNNVCVNIYGNSYYSISEIQDLCSNPTKLSEIKSTCSSYIDLNGQNEEIQNACNIALSGEIDKSCEQLKSINFVNMSSLETDCLLYKNNRITDSQFFTRFMLSVTQIPQDIDTKSALYIFAAAILALVLLFFIAKKKNELIYNLGRVSFSIGLNLVLFQTIIYIFKKFIHIDSSVILSGFGQSLPTTVLIKQSLPIIIPLMMYRFLDLSFIIVGLILAIVGFLFKKYYKSTSNI